ncbi:MAG: OmpA family protein [Desulfobacterales bacterium]
MAAAALLLAACAPNSQVSRLEGQLQDQRRSTALAAQRLEAEVKQRQQAEQELTVLQQAAVAYRSQIATLAARSAAAEDKNLQFATRLSDLQREIEKRNAAIELQNRVIRLLDDTKETIETSLKERLAAQKIKLEDLDGIPKMTFVDKILFDPGSAEIPDEGRRRLYRIAETLNRQQEALIVIEGHTDSLPIAPAAAQEKFPSNWELSAARASAVARFLAGTAGIDSRRLAASGFSGYRPAAPNDTADGRRQNRRVEIFLNVLR